jgi:hypothetical protein
MGKRIAETVVNAIPRGSARTMDYVSSPPWMETVGNVAYGIDVVDRPGQIRNSAMFTVGAGAAGTQWMTYRGRAAFHLTGTGVSTGVVAMGNSVKMAWKTLAGGGVFSNTPLDYACWRIAFLMACDQIAGGPPQVRDYGFGVGPGFNGDVFSATNAGIMITPRSPALTDMGIMVRQVVAGAITIDQPLAHQPATFDYSDWNHYDIRFISGTGTAPGFCRVVVNGIQEGVFNYGPGSLMFDPTNGGTALATTWGFTVRGLLGGIYMTKGGILVSASSTEQGLL